MRSGLFDYFSNDAWIRAWLTDPRREWTPRQLLAYSFSKPLRFAPGTSFNYSNPNFVLLGRDPEGVPPAAGHLHQAAHPEARAPDAHELPGRRRVPVPPRAGLHRLDGRMHLLAQVREDRQRHELEHVSRLGGRSDGLHAGRSPSLGPGRSDRLAAHPSHPETASAVHPRTRHKEIWVWPCSQQTQRLDRSQRRLARLRNLEHLPALPNRPQSSCSSTPAQPIHP